MPDLFHLDVVPDPDTSFSGKRLTAYACSVFSLAPIASCGAKRYNLPACQRRANARAPAHRLPGCAPGSLRIALVQRRQARPTSLALAFERPIPSTGLGGLGLGPGSQRRQDSLP